MIMSASNPLTGFHFRRASCVKVKISELYAKVDLACLPCGLVVDDESKTITVDGEFVHLTPVQYKILKLLIANTGRVFSIDEIYERVWEEPAYSPENTVSVHIRKIREKIEINPKTPEYLKVVWGVGYKIEKI